MEIKDKIIDLKSDFKSSKSKFYRNLPNFVINILRKIIREDFINNRHSIYKELIGMDYVNALINDEFKVKINISGQKKIDKKKNYVFVANHPLGAIDALSFLHLVETVRGRVVSPSNELFEHIPNVHPLIVGINVFGQNTKARIKMLNETFNSDAQVMIFPSGEVSRNINGKIIDPEWKKTFVTKAVEYKRDIVPVHFDGQNSKKFYRIAKIRKFLGIKTYLETILLPQELLKKYNTEVNITIGKTISYQEIENSKMNHKQWAQKIKDYVYSLKS